MRCRSRLYPERYWLRYTTDLLCIGVSGLNSFPGSGSAGLGLFADCSANLDVLMKDINPRAEVFAEGTSSVVLVVLVFRGSITMTSAAIG